RAALTDEALAAGLKGRITWYAITEANRIFGFDGWNRETLESRCAHARENRGTFLAVYIARVRVTVRADSVTIIREGHGSGEGRGNITRGGARHCAEGWRKPMPLNGHWRPSESRSASSSIAVAAHPRGLCPHCLLSLGPPTPVSASILTIRPLFRGRPASM